MIVWGKFLCVSNTWMSSRTFFLINNTFYINSIYMSLFILANRLIKISRMFLSRLIFFWSTILTDWTPFNHSFLIMTSYCSSDPSGSFILLTRYRAIRVVGKGISSVEKPYQSRRFFRPCSHHSSRKRRSICHPNKHQQHLRTFRNECKGFQRRVLYPWLWWGRIFRLVLAS